jgi:hypothetical protein
VMRQSRHKSNGVVSKTTICFGWSCTDHDYGQLERPDVIFMWLKGERNVQKIREQFRKLPTYIHRALREPPLRNNEERGGGSHGEDARKRMGRGEPEASGRSMGVHRDLVDDDTGGGSRCLIPPFQDLQIPAL